MCKFLINEVMLGKRVVGYEIFSQDTGEIIGYTEKKVKEEIKVGERILGFILDKKGQLQFDTDFCKNIMQKIGIGNLKPKFETNCIINLMYTAIRKKDTGYEVISSRFKHEIMTEEKLKTLYELGAVNGVYTDEKGKLFLYTDKKELSIAKKNT